MFTVLLFLSFFDFSVYAANLYVSAESAVLLCAETGEVLYSKNADKSLSMASTTKIMTSLIAIEAATPDLEITVLPEMVKIEGTSMGLLPGDKVSLEELVYGMLLQSGNDAANVTAYALGGSPEGFAKLMNERALQIGMVNTNFVTASGLDDENHYSTAYDMALLARECIGNPEFAFICSQKKATLTYGNPPYSRTLTNHNKLLWKYEDCIGIKTGFTKKSGRCLVSAAKRNGVTLVAVTLNAPDDWDDHISMFEYGFSRCKKVNLFCNMSKFRVKVAGGISKTAEVELLHTPYLINRTQCRMRVLIKPMIYAPVSKGEIVGKALFVDDNSEVIFETPIILSESVEFKNMPNNINETKPDLVQKLKDFFNFQR